MIVTVMNTASTEEKKDPPKDGENKKSEADLIKDAQAKKLAAIEKKMAELAMAEDDEDEEMQFTEVKHEAAEE